ncbi:MAG: fimbrillin family protein [Bacteroidales bacterium]|nr:fimbrillin family protein [Bacteroidales bacterium]
MKNYRIFIIAAAALVLGACQEKESLAPRKQAIRFTTNLGAYTKATDTNFEEGDAVSLFAEAPINALNVKMVCRGGELIPETPVYWNEDQPANQYTNFFAVYPYRDDWEDLSDLSVFSVNADQRTHAQYTASDLLGASYMAYPDCETVPLNFTHRLCRLNVEVYTYSSDLSVADVYLKEAYGKVRVSIFHRMNVTTVGARGAIRMGKLYDNTWSAIVPPQAVDFPVVVVMSDGTMYEFSAESWSQVYMESAKSYTAHIEIDNQTTTISGSIAVENWTADNDAAFGNYIADEYHTEGWWYIKEVGTDNYQELIYNTFDGVHFEAGLNTAAGTKYELVYQNGRRELTFGLENTATASVGGEYILKENGSAFSFSAAGECVVKVFPYSGLVVIAADDEVWSVVGDFGDNPWNTDLDMVRESSGIYSIEFESHGEEFKLRANHNWDKNLGCYYQLQGGYRYPLQYGGSNMQLNEAGRYQLTLDSRSCTLTVILLESYATADAFAQIMGSWQCMDTNGNNYSVAIYDNGYPDCIVRLYDFDIAATFDLPSGKVKVCFQRLGEWNWGDYGLVYDYFLAHSGGQNFFLEEDGSVALFYLEKTAGGNILVSPGKYDGEVFDSFEFITIIQEGDFAGLYARYGVAFPLPMTWTPAN